MARESPVSSDQARAFYEDFSLAVGIRDWLAPNARHEHLKVQINEILSGRTGLQILDVGCGAGVMTDHLRRFGTVTGIDFSAAAIAAARRFTARRFGSQPTFLVGSLDAIPRAERFDVITLFDVLEHIPEEQRRGFLSSARRHLVDGGLLFASTPHPAYTKLRRDRGDDTLQIIDEQVRVGTLLDEVAECGLELIGFRAYDVFTGTPEFQAMLFTTARTPGRSPTLRNQRVDRKMRFLLSRPGRVACRLTRAARLLAAGERITAGKMVRGNAPHVRS
jgi:SAM-dependent methyltransferase